MKGVVSEEDVAAGRVRVIAPEGFLEAAISENVLAGTIMTRRATYMYGVLLPRDPQGNVGIGLGMATSRGTSTLIPPTETITETGQPLDIDGADLRVPAGARHRGAGGDALVHPRAAAP